MLSNDSSSAQEVFDDIGVYIKRADQREVRVETFENSFCEFSTINGEKGNDKGSIGIQRNEIIVQGNQAPDKSREELLSVLLLKAKEEIALGSSDSEEEIEKRAKIKYNCMICNHHFTRKNGFDIHLKRHMKEKAFKCEKCPASFVTKDELYFHLKRHMVITYYTCNVCNYTTR